MGSADELNELDRMIEEEELFEEVSLDMAMGPDLIQKKKGKYRSYRKNRDFQYKYKGVKRNLIKWKRLNPNTWFDIDQWKKARIRKDQEPEWKLNLTERSLRELVGRFIDCIGDCKVFRGEGFSGSQFRSIVRELDEVVTSEDSYAWIAMMDGTLVRISPNTSISFKEINIGKKENFIHLRINFGNVLLLNRHAGTLNERNARETDRLFLPLSLREANPKGVNIKLNEDDLSNFIKKDKTMMTYYQKLNSLIKENNQFVKNKPTYSMVVTPTGTIYGKNMQTEFIVLLGGHSFIKQRSLQEQGFEKFDKNESQADFYYRGFKKREKFPLKIGRWFQVGTRGRVISALKDSLKFRAGEYITSNIPSIYMAREMFLKNKSQFLFLEKLNRKNLAETTGYRLWGDINNKGDDLFLRIKFLLEYTRRIETSNLVVAEQFRRKTAERGELVASTTYDRSFYSKAIQEYIVGDEQLISIDTDREILNSTKKAFWKIINGSNRR